MQSGLTAEFGAALCDFGIESFDSDTEAASLCFARAIIFSGGKASEPFEGLRIADRIDGFVDYWTRLRLTSARQVGGYRHGWSGGFVECWICGLGAGADGVCFHNSFVFLDSSLRRGVGQWLSNLENSFRKFCGAK